MLDLFILMVFLTAFFACGYMAGKDKFKISKAIEALKNNEPEEVPLPEEEPF